MLVKSTVTLLLASLAVAAPVKQDSMKVTFINKIWSLIEKLDVPMDGTAVPITGDNNDTTISVIGMECLGKFCTHGYYCTLYDRDLAPTVKLKTPRLGSLFGPFYETGQITCEYEPVPAQQLEATEAPATEP